MGNSEPNNKNTGSQISSFDEQNLSIIENSPDIFMRFDRDRRHLYVNRSVEKVVSIPRGEFIGKTHRELGFPEEHCQYWESRISSVFKSGEPHESEFEYSDEKGPHIFNWRLVPEFNTTGDITSVLSISRDITKTKVTEDRLRESIQTFDDVMQSIPFGIFVYQFSEPDHLILVDGNHEAEKLSGITIDDCRGKEFDDLWPNARKEGITDSYLSVMKTGNILESEYLSIKDNESVYRIKAFPLPGSRLCVFIECITERKKVETAFRNIEKKYNTLIETSPDGIYFTDINGNIEHMSKSALALYGYKTQSDVLGKNILELLIPDEHNRAKENNLRLLKSRKRQVANYMFMGKNGGMFVGEATTALITDHKGDPQGFSYHIRDITDTNKAAEEQGKFIALIENSNEFIGIASLDGQVTYLNKSGRELVGLESMEEVKKTTILDYVSEEYYPHLQETVIPCVMQNGVWDGQSQIRQFKTGGLIDVEITTFLINSTEGHEPTAIATVMRDITEKKYLETQLVQSQKMEAIGTLAGGIAHDFNNILAAIIGYTELAIDQVDESSDIYGDLKEVLSSGHRAKELVSQILTFSRKRKEERKPLLASAIVKEVIKFLRATLPSTIQIKEKIDQNLNYILADPTQIHQVLMNLCTNAAFSMQDEGGILEIKLENIEPHAMLRMKHPHAQPGQHVRLSVKDTGMGMSEDVIKRIYEPYFTTKGLGEGTGLGMSVVHGIISNYNGFIELISKEGVGTIFEVYIPAIDGDDDSEETAINSLEKGTGKIIVIDDEPNILKVITRNLERLGYSVTAKETGAEAIEVFMAAPERYDLIITDMTMPVMTGDVLARELLKIRGDIPIIICTGFSESATYQKVRDLPIRKLLLKPVSIKEMATTIHSILNTAR